MYKRLWTSVFAAIGILILILDTKTAIIAAQDGITLCLMTVVPSLFPFFILSILLTSSLSGINSPLLKPLGKLLGAPSGSESIFLIGILGGYPTGAKAVIDSYEAKQISKSSARRMLAFCSNAGPAFIFGIAATAFPHQNLGWALWIIHIISAVLVAICLPKRSYEAQSATIKKEISIMDAFRQSITLTAQVCGWILLFRVVIAFLQRWSLWLLPSWIQISIIGILELANGCTSLVHICSTGLRFILCSGILAFGGLCVLMQTYSIAGKLGISPYLGGKALQLLLSVLLAYLYQGFFLDDAMKISGFSLSISALFLVFIVIYLRNKKKIIAFVRKIVYNNLNTLSRRHTYAISKEN